MLPKKKILLSLFVLSLILMPFLALAQGTSNASLPTLTLATLPQSLPNVVSQVINALLYVVGTVAVIFLIIAGFQFIVAAGNPDGVQKARAAALNTVLGLIIIILSNAAVKFVISYVAR